MSQPQELTNLAEALIPMTFDQDDLIIKQGQRADGMYFIVTGEVKVMSKTADEDQVLVGFSCL